MENIDLYKTWRDKLLAEVSKYICSPCTDKRKKQYNLDYKNPLNCGCRCEHVEIIIMNAKEIDDKIKKYSNQKT